MSDSEQRTFDARFDALQDAALFVQSFCERNGVHSDATLRLAFIVEELFTNTVEHGHGGESAAPIRVTLWMEERQAMLLFEDTAPAYDPLARCDVSPESLAVSAESREVGGLGVYIVSRFVVSARYAREEGFNRLWLAVRCDG